MVVRLSISRLFSAVFLAAVVIPAFPRAADATQVIRRAIDPGALAILKQGRTLGLEVHPPGGRGTRSFLSRYLAESDDWSTYRGRVTAFIPLSRVKPEVRRRIVLAIYPDDIVDARGWVHTVVDDGETLWSLSEWITGRGSNYTGIMRAPVNNLIEPGLRRGQKVVIPGAYLNAAMRRLTTNSFTSKSSRFAIRRSGPDDLRYGSNGLSYGSDERGAYAMYILRPGEALYSAVARRFTDYTDNAQIVKACEAIARRSGIARVEKVRVGQKIYIPVGLLSERYRPNEGASPNVREEPLEDQISYRETRARPRNMSDVLVILDAGHGGTDTGAKHIASGLYEDEINYDIVLRIKELIEKQTDAKVALTVTDRSSRFVPSDRRRFHYDTDEQLNTTPPHRNDQSASVSANLRWMLVNSIFDRHVKSGGDPSKVIFTSIHTDSLYDSRLRGAMIYTPGAKFRRSVEKRTDKIYAAYAEGRKYNTFVSTSSERRRDEALSRSFATVLMDNLGKRRIKRHDQGDPIRSQIRRSRNRSYVPAVLRNTKVPTKVLVETANLKNSTDRQRLADPWWREQFAQAYVDALKVYYGADKSIVTAKAR